MMRIVSGYLGQLSMDEKSILIHNAIRCKHCFQVIESKYQYDAVQCNCTAVGVDGGLLYDRIMGNREDYEQLQQWLIYDLR